MSRLLRLRLSTCPASLPPQGHGRVFPITRPTLRAGVISTAPARTFQTSAQRSNGNGNSTHNGPMPDSLADRDARGRTGGGKPLETTASGAPPKPKISNASVPGQNEGLTEEQKREVEAHNRDFEKKHDRAAPASDDKVNKKFWKERPQ